MLSLTSRLGISKLLEALLPRVLLKLELQWRFLDLGFDLTLAFLTGLINHLFFTHDSVVLVSQALESQETVVIEQDCRYTIHHKLDLEWCRADLDRISVAGAILDSQDAAVVLLEALEACLGGKTIGLDQNSVLDTVVSGVDGIPLVDPDANDVVVEQVELKTESCG